MIVVDNMSVAAEALSRLAADSEVESSASRSVLSGNPERRLAGLHDQ